MTAIATPARHSPPRQRNWKPPASQPFALIYGAFAGIPAERVKLAIDAAIRLNARNVTVSSVGELLEQTEPAPSAVRHTPTWETTPAAPVDARHLERVSASVSRPTMRQDYAQRIAAILAKPAPSAAVFAEAERQAARFPHWGYLPSANAYGPEVCPCPEAARYPVRLVAMVEVEA